MTTPGILTLTDNGEVKTKVVTDLDGTSVAELKEWVIQQQDFTSDELYEKAITLFNSDELIVQTNQDHFLYNENKKLEDLSHYVESFNKPKFNPNLNKETTSNTAVIDISNKKYKQDSNDQIINLGIRVKLTGGSSATFSYQHDLIMLHTDSSNSQWHPDLIGPMFTPSLNHASLRIGFYTNQPETVSIYQSWSFDIESESKLLWFFKNLGFPCHYPIPLGANK